jgi:hypothetical protein
MCGAVYEVFERMAYYGISSNLVLYLTTELHQGTVLSANNVTNWVGTIWMTPIIGAYIADAHLGRYRTFMVASIIYLLVSPHRPSCRFVPCAPPHFLFWFPLLFFRWVSLTLILLR